MKNINRNFLLLIMALLLLIGNNFSALANQNIPDQYPESVLYSKPVKIMEGVWSAIGATGPQTYENSGHNNNLSFIITTDGVAVINGGGCYELAKALHDEIKILTDQPVKLVINENGQGHAMLGNSYWAELNVPIIAHRDGLEAFEELGEDLLERMQGFNKEKAKGTVVTLPTETFEGRKVITMGDTRIELIAFGPAHSAGDISVWLPEKDVIFAGDMAFHQRLLPIFEESETALWLESWELFAAMNVTHVVPGHGVPTNMTEVTKYTKDYLIYIREKVREVIDADGSLKDSYEIDQSPYAHLDTFKELAKRNAERVFREMEFE